MPITREEWQRLSQVETAARDARDQLLSLVDSGETMTKRARAVIERCAEEIRIAVNGSAA